ncbi:MAG: hypothetical protein JWM96_1363 [Alphaproteobacteria bacterium]|nr:hypothetical protein [Alphaproteobacteria bacterium]
MKFETNIIGQFSWLSTCALFLLTSAVSGEGASRTIQPTTRLDPIPLICELRGARRVVVNSGSTIIEKSQRIGWKDSSGEEGTSVLQRPLYPREKIVVGGRSQGPTCSAWALPVPAPLMLEIAPN